MSWVQAKTYGGYDSAVIVPSAQEFIQRRAERLRELAENNPLGDYLRLLRLSPTPRKWCCTTIRWR